VSNVTTCGIDLAKNVFSLHAVDGHGVVVLRKTVTRARLVAVVAQLPACVIGLEACSGAHEWARRFAQHGHTVKLMAPKFVAPYRKSGKNDSNDAEAICEAVSRPSMRFVPVRSVEQQAMLTLHRVRLALSRSAPQRSTGSAGCWRSSAWCCRSEWWKFAAVRRRCSISCRRWHSAP
jgi:transposase